MRSIQNCRVAVVGGAGFLGSHLVDHLVNDRNCNVLVVDNLCSGHMKFVNRKADFEHGDITVSESFLLRLFRHYRVEYVFNYAACPYIPVSFERPLHVFGVNATGALHVINAAQEAECKGILQVSSAEIYGEGVSFESGARISEGFPVVPHSSYGASKAAIDAMVQVRWRESKTPVIALRQFNCVGARETHPYVIPEIIQQLSHSKRILLGNNSARDFLYAGDQAIMACELLEMGDFGEVYNLGSENSIRIYNLAHIIGELMRYNEIEITTDSQRIRPWEIWNLVSANDKIYSVINARPKVSLEEALKITIQYYASNGSRWDWQHARI